MSGRDWAILLTLSVLWGGSFFFIEIAVETVTPLSLVLVRVALAADTVSIAVMEVLDNAFMLALPGAMEAGLGDPLFWAALAAALVIAFVLTVPVNHWMIGRGRGHAVVHAMH